MVSAYCAGGEPFQSGRATQISWDFLTRVAEQLFKVFGQRDIGYLAREGLGLGLSLSQQYVKLLGGEITVDSDVGRGSTFKFDIIIERDQVEWASGPEIQEKEQAVELTWEQLR